MTPHVSTRHSKASSSSKAKPSIASSTLAGTTEVSFRTIVEEMAAESNLLFVATGRTNERGYQLFRVSKGVDGKSGVTVYLDGDVVWLQGGKEGEWEPVSIGGMVEKALK